MGGTGLDLGLAGRAAAVTGAGAGIGRASALALARAGARVAVNDLDAAAAERVAQDIRDAGGTALAVPFDVSDRAALEQGFAAAAQALGPIEVLVANAGIGARMASVDLPPERWQRVLDVGLTGAFACAQVVAPGMIAAGRGSIVYVASIMGLCGGGLYPNPAYHAVKGALVNLTRALALEWAPHGIRVNAVAPAFTRTALVEPLLADRAMMEKIVEATPLGRLVEPEEVAAAILFLAGDAAAMVTGHTLPVDGGWLAR